MGQVKGEIASKKIVSQKPNSICSNTKLTIASYLENNKNIDDNYLKTSKR